MENLIISIINGTLDERLHSKLINQNGNRMKTPKISNAYNDSTTYKLDLSSDCQDVTHKTPLFLSILQTPPSPMEVNDHLSSGCQDVTHETPPFLDILPTPPPPMEGNDSSVIIDEPSFQFNNSPINLDKIEFRKLNKSIFSFIKSNYTVTKEAVRMALKRRADEIATSIAGSSVVNGEDQLQHDQKSLALHKACSSADIQKIAKIAGLFPLGKNESKELTIYRYIVTKISSILENAQNTNSPQGNVLFDHSNFITTVISACLNNMIDSEDAPSISEIGKLLGIKKESCWKKIKRALEHQSKVHTGVSKHVYRRRKKGHSKISQEIREAAVKFVKGHQFLRDSPNYKHTLKINGQSVGKLIRLCSVRELHNDLTEKVPEMKDVISKVLISDTSLCKTLREYVPELKKASNKHRSMCCCQLCISTKFQFGALTSYCRNKLASMPQDEEKENYESSIGGETLKDDLNKVMCQPVTLENGKKYLNA